MLEGSGLNYDTLASLCNLSAAYSDVYFRSFTVARFKDAYEQGGGGPIQVVNYDLIGSDVVNSTIVPMEGFSQPVAPFFYVSIPKLRLTVKTSPDNLVLKLFSPKPLTLQIGDVYKVKNDDDRDYV